MSREICEHGRSQQTYCVICDSFKSQPNRRTVEEIAKEIHHNLHVNSYQEENQEDVQLIADAISAERKVADEAETRIIEFKLCNNEQGETIKKLQAEISSLKAEAEALRAITALKDSAIKGQQEMLAEKDLQLPLLKKKTGC